MEVRRKESGKSRAAKRMPGIIKRSRENRGVLRAPNWISRRGDEQPGYRRGGFYQRNWNVVSMNHPRLLWFDLALESSWFYRTLYRIYRGGLFMHEDEPPFFLTFFPYRFPWDCRFPGLIYWNVLRWDMAIKSWCWWEFNCDCYVENKSRICTNNIEFVCYSIITFRWEQYLYHSSFF